MPTDRVLIFREKAFPAFFGDDGAVDLASVLAAKSRRPEPLPVGEMAAALASGTGGLAVFATGSFAPFDLWPAFLDHVRAGGHLLWLGGPPAETALARRERGRFTREGPDGALREALGIAAVASVPAERIARYALPAEGGENPFDAAALAALPVEPSFSLVIRSNRDGARVRAIRPLAHGIGFDGLVRSAPIVTIDRLEGEGAGGRMVFVTLAGRRLAPLVPILPLLADHALRGASELWVEPELATYYAGEKPAVRVAWRTPGRSKEVRLRIRVQRDERGEPLAAAEATARSGVSSPGASDFRVTLPFEAAPGLYRVFADVEDAGGSPLGSLRTGFFGFDEELLARQTRLRADGRYFYGAEPEAVPLLGATYHDIEWGERFFLHPNPDRWERDFADLRAIGLNTVRTGLRSGWADVMGEDQMFREESLRAFDAFFHAAAAHGLQVIFSLFSVAPDPWGSGHPYLSQGRIACQRTFVEVVSRRFRDHKHVAFDLVESPAFASRRRPCAEAAPYGDAEERDAWAKFLESRHGDPAAVARAWGRPALAPPPDFSSFAPPGRASRRAGGAATDFRFFAQEAFSSWADAMAGAMRKKGRHLVTVSQSPAEESARPSPAFFHPAVDFTVAAAPGDAEDLLFEILAARMPQKPCLVGEPACPAGAPGASPVSPAREEASRDRLERKIVVALVASGAGVVDGEWHADPSILGRLLGPVRSDGSFAADVEVFAAAAKFLRAVAPFVSEPRPEDVFVVLAHSAVFGRPGGEAALRSARRAIRAFQQQTGREASVVPEGRVKDVGRRRLFVLPSVPRLSEDAWKALLRSVRGGSRLLVSGPIGRDEYGVDRGRLAAFDIESAPAPVAQEELFRLGRRPLALRYDDGARAFAEKDVVARRGRAARRRGDLFEFDHGLGKVLYSTLPFEANGSRSAVGALYEFACRWAGVETVYRVKERDPGVLVRAVAYGRSRLYGLVSETSEVRAVEILDRTAGARVRTFIEPGRANLILVRDSGEIIKMREA